MKLLPICLKSSKKVLATFILSNVLIFLPACMITIHPPPPTGPCTFTFTNIFPGCYSTLSGNTEIKFKATFIVWYINGNDKEQLDLQNLNSSASSPSSFTVNSVLPKDGTEWEVEITIEATQCSTCALTQTPTTTCLQISEPGGESAAFPALHYSGIGVGYRTSIGPINTYSYQENVAGSCGCVVPN